MRWLLFICALGGFLAVLIVLAAMSRHKKSAISEVQLVGCQAQVDSPLGPDGTVLVHGELWRARSADGTSIASRTIVQVVGLSGHLLLVQR